LSSFSAQRSGFGTHKIEGGAERDLLFAHSTADPRERKTSFSHLERTECARRDDNDLTAREYLGDLNALLAIPTNSLLQLLIEQNNKSIRQHTPGTHA